MKSKIKLNKLNSNPNKAFYIFFLAIFFALLAALTSCEDSLGIDPNVVKYRLSQDTTDTTDNKPDITIYEVKKSYWEFYEALTETNRYTWSPSVYTFNSKIMIDTSKSDKYVWIQLELESNVPDAALANRNDRVKSLKFKIDSVKTSGAYFLDGNFGSYNWLNIYIKDIKKGNTLVYSGKEVRASLFLKDYPEYGVIEGFFGIDLSTIGTNTAGFFGTFTISYK